MRAVSSARGDEQARPEQTSLGVFPPDQRFDELRGAGVQGDSGLVVQPELAGTNGSP